MEKILTKGDLIIY